MVEFFHQVYPPVHFRNRNSFFFFFYRSFTFFSDQALCPPLCCAFALSFSLSLSNSRTCTYDHTHLHAHTYPLFLSRTFSFNVQRSPVETKPRLTSIAIQSIVQSNIQLWWHAFAFSRRLGFAHCKEKLEWTPEWLKLIGNKKSDRHVLMK